VPRLLASATPTCPWPTIAALVEIDAVKAVHVGLVRKCVAIHEVEARRAAGLRRLRWGFIVGAVEEIGGRSGRRPSASIPPAPGCRQPNLSPARIGEGQVRPSSRSSPSQAAITPRLSERSSTATLARNL